MFPTAYNFGRINPHMGDLDTAVPVACWDANASYRVTEPQFEGRPDDLLWEVLGLPVFSPRLRHGLDRAGINGIQYLPVTLFHLDGTKEEGFSVANVLNLRQALDLEQSWYDPIPEGKERRRPCSVSGITTAVVRGNALEGVDICRLEEFDVWLLVSQKFKDIYDSLGCTGAEFTPLKVV